MSHAVHPCSKYHEQIGGSACHASMGVGMADSQCSVGSASQAYSSQDEGFGGPSRWLIGSHSKAPSLLTPSMSKFAGMKGGAPKQPHTAAVELAVLKRVVDQEGRLDEQATLITRLESKLDCAVEANRQLRDQMVELPTMMRALSDQLHEAQVAAATAHEQQTREMMRLLAEQLRSQVTNCLLEAQVTSRTGDSPPDPLNHRSGLLATSGSPPRVTGSHASSDSATAGQCQGPHRYAPSVATPVHTAPRRKRRLPPGYEVEAHGAATNGCGWSSTPSEQNKPPCHASSTEVLDWWHALRSSENITWPCQSQPERMAAVPASQGRSFSVPDDSKEEEEETSGEALDLFADSGATSPVEPISSMQNRPRRRRISM